MERRKYNLDSIQGMDLRDDSLQQQLVSEVVNLRKDKNGWRIRDSYKTFLSLTSSDNFVSGVIINKDQAIAQIGNSLYLYSVKDGVLDSFLRRFDFNFTFKMFKTNYVNVVFLVDTQNGKNYVCEFTDEMLSFVTDEGDLNLSTELLLHVVNTETREAKWSFGARHDDVTGYDTSVNKYLAQYNAKDKLWVKTVTNNLDPTFMQIIMVSVINDSAGDPHTYVYKFPQNVSNPETWESKTELTITGTAASGGSTTTIILDTAGQAEDSTYVNLKVKVNFSTPEITTITDYDSATNTATVSPALSAAPDGYTYDIYGDLMATNYLEATYQEGINNTKYAGEAYSLNLVNYNGVLYLISNAGIYKYISSNNLQKMIDATSLEDYATLGGGILYKEKIFFTVLTSSSVHLYSYSNGIASFVKSLASTSNGIVITDMAVNGDDLYIGSQPLKAYSTTDYYYLWKYTENTDTLTIIEQVDNGVGLLGLCIHNNMLYYISEATYDTPRVKYYNPVDSSITILATGTLGSVDYDLIDYNGDLYLTQGGTLYKWNTSTLVFDSIGVEGDYAKNLFIYNNVLYVFATGGTIGTHFGTWDGTTYTATVMSGLDIGVLTGAFYPTYDFAIVVWNNVLSIFGGGYILELSITTSDPLDIYFPQASYLLKASINGSTITLSRPQTNTIAAYEIKHFVFNTTYSITRFIAVAVTDATVATTDSVQVYNETDLATVVSSIATFSNYNGMTITTDSDGTKKMLVAYNSQIELISLSYTSSFSYSRVAIGTNLPTGMALGTQHCFLSIAPNTHFADNTYTNYVYAVDSTNNKIIRYPITGNYMTDKDVSNIETYIVPEISAFADVDGYISGLSIINPKGYKLTEINKANNPVIRPYFGQTNQTATVASADTDTQAVLAGTQEIIQSYELASKEVVDGGEPVTYRTPVDIGNGSKVYSVSDDALNYWIYWIIGLIHTGLYDDAAYINIGRGVLNGGQYSLKYWTNYSTESAIKQYPSKADTTSLSSLPKRFFDITSNAPVTLDALTMPAYELLYNEKLLYGIGIKGTTVATYNRKGDTTNGSNKITNVDSITSLEIGDAISGGTIPANSVITNIDSSSGLELTISNAAAATATAVALTVTREGDKGAYDKFSASAHYEQYRETTLPFQDMLQRADGMTIALLYEKSMVYYDIGLKYICLYNYFGTTTPPTGIREMYQDKCVITTEQGVFLFSGYSITQTYLTLMVKDLGLERENYNAIATAGNAVFIWNKYGIYKIMQNYGVMEHNRISYPIEEYLNELPSGNVIEIDQQTGELYVPLLNASSLSVEVKNGDYSFTADETITYDINYGVFNIGAGTWRIYAYENDTNIWTPFLFNFKGNVIVTGDGNNLIYPEYLVSEGTENPVARIAMKRTTFGNSFDITKIFHIGGDWVKGNDYGIDYLRVKMIANDTTELTYKYGNFNGTGYTDTVNGQTNTLPAGTEINYILAPRNNDVKTLRLTFEFGRLGDSNYSVTSMKDVVLDIIHKRTEKKGIY